MQQIELSEHFQAFSSAVFGLLARAGLLWSFPQLCSEDWAKFKHLYLLKTLKKRAHQVLLTHHLVAARALQFLLLEQRSISWSWLLLGAILVYFNGDTNIWSSKQKQITVQSLTQQPLCRRKSKSETPWASPQPGGDPGSTAYSKTPLETLSTNLQTVQYVSWELHPASKPLAFGKGRVEVHDQTSKMGPDQSRLAPKHIRNHHHTPHISNLGQVWNTKIYWHHCIDQKWERIIMWTKVAISQNSPWRGKIYTEKEPIYTYFYSWCNLRGNLIKCFCQHELSHHWWNELSACVLPSPPLSLLELPEISKAWALVLQLYVCIVTCGFLGWKWLLFGAILL